MYLTDRLSTFVRGLSNSLTSLGTAADKARVGTWGHTPLDPGQLEAMYRSGWIPRKVVDIPAFDMMRAGWSWQASKENIELIEAEQKRLGILQKVYHSLVLARLFGGSVIYLGDGSPDPMAPLNLESIGKGGLKYVTVFSRNQISVEDIDKDPISPNYLEPTYYQLSSESQGYVLIHPSRVVKFSGAFIPNQYEMAIDTWSDSVLDAVDQAIVDATSGQQCLASMMQEAKIDVIKVPDLTEKVTSETYRGKLEERFRSAFQLKSMINTLVLDSEEEYSQKTITFNQLPDVIRTQLQIVSGAADIPATRFLGQSPDGLNATGEGDLRNYYDRIKAEQEINLAPPMQKLMDVLVRSAIGSYPEDIWFSFNSLWQPTEKDMANIAKVEAETDGLLLNSKLVPSRVIREAVKNRLIERGQLPGIQAAYEAYGKDDVLEAMPEPTDKTPAPSIPELGREKGPGGVTDARPRTLFMYRRVRNARTIIEWAKKQGFNTVITPSQMHVTIAYSRNPVDWMRMGAFWGSDKLDLPKGGPRIVEPLGDNGAVVLLFSSTELQWRHKDLIDQGASWDWPEYQPHITLSYDASGVDLENIKPYMGQILLGPEVFEEIDDEFEATER